MNNLANIHILDKNKLICKKCGGNIDFILENFQCSGSKRPILLIGGYPKVYSLPSHPETKSGRRLETIRKKHNLCHFTVFDLWQTREEAMEGHIKSEALETIKKCQKTYRVIALGIHVHRCLMMYGLNIEKLPHPASRRKKDIKELEDGLKIGPKMFI